MGPYVYDGGVVSTIISSENAGFLLKNVNFLHFFKIKFGVLKIVRIFAVQYRGIEQSVARRAHNPKVVRFESHSRYQ